MGGSWPSPQELHQLVKMCHNSAILSSLLCLPFSFSFTSLWVTWLYLVMGHMSSHMMGHMTCRMMRAHYQSPDHGLFLLCIWVTITLYVVFHLFLAYVSLYLIPDSPGSFRIIDSYCHIIPYSMMTLHTCTYLFLGTPVVVYKSGILGTQSPRLDFSCNMVLVNWSSTRRNFIPHLFYLRHSLRRLCVLRGVTHHQKL